uniref:Uncharacterized protein n=1 Tax=Neobodo designis TaxID=312471 RepID=A0A6U4SH02_NEODS|mmetsp:Transcript_31559/g.97496  ORF Transcript_31559/g.97496 Transcript_31559/m.97496 type:complete len:222 (+) Transcript_31559:64-729(+)
MPSKPTPESFIGCKIAATLITGQTVTGTVFTYDMENAALVVLEKPGEDRPNVKVLNTCFIKDISVLEKAPADPADKLPRGVIADATLPSLTGANENLQRKLNKALSRAEDRRRYDSAGDAAEFLTIAACQLFDRISILGSTAFSATEEHLQRAKDIAHGEGTPVGEPRVVIILGDVLVTDNGGAGGVSWMSPIVGAAKDGGDAHGNAQRVKQACAAAFKQQ